MADTNLTPSTTDLQAKNISSVAFTGTVSNTSFHLDARFMDGLFCIRLDHPDSGAASALNVVMTDGSAITGNPVTVWSLGDAYNNFVQFAYFGSTYTYIVVDTLNFPGIGITATFPSTGNVSGVVRMPIKLNNG